MSFMIAFGWVGAMLLLGTILRAKIKILKNNLVPACVIGGIIGFIIFNVLPLVSVDVTMFGEMTTHFFTLSFISIGLTSLPKSSESSGTLVKTAVKGAVAIGALWTMLWAITPLLGYLVLKIAGVPFQMDGTYGLLIPTAFCDGPGVAMTIGSIFEGYGWPDASQVALTYAVIGFLLAFLVGVPMAKRGLQKNIASYPDTLSTAISRGIYTKDEQTESMGMHTTYHGNIDTLALHLALLGFCFLLANLIAALFASIPTMVTQLMSSFLFLHGLLAAYFVKWIMNKWNLTQYQNETLQARITGSCTDFLVCSSFMAIQVSIIGKWVIPILITCLCLGIITFVISIYFGSRIGGKYDFERTLGLWGCATGTTATGLALIRIVDPNLKTTAATELGAMNVTAAFFSLGVYTAIPLIAAANAGQGDVFTGVGICLITAIGCLLILKIFKVWGKKTYDLKKGISYYKTEQQANNTTSEQ